jgi:MFS family permease
LPTGKPRYARDPAVERSLRLALREAVASALMAGIGDYYLTAYALSLAASTRQIAALAAIPQLLGALAQLVATWWGSARGWRKRYIVGGAFVQAWCWWGIALLPVLFPDSAALWLVGMVALSTVAAQAAAPHLACLLRDLVPERRRGRYFARRTRVAAQAAFLAVVVGGVGLDLAKDWAKEWGGLQAGFLALFALAFGARLAGAFLLRRIEDPEDAAGQVAAAAMQDPAHPERVEGPAVTSGDPARPALVEGPATPPRPAPREWLRALRGSIFLQFSWRFAALQGVSAIASPFFGVHLLREMGVSYVAFMGFTAAGVLMQIVMLPLWGVLADLLGDRPVLLCAGLLIPFIPALWIWSDDYLWLCFVNVFGGLCWAGFSLSSGNALYALEPARPIAPFLALHAVLVGGAISLGAWFGGWLSEAVPGGLAALGLSGGVPYALYPVFVASALGRVLVILSLLPLLGEIRARPARRRLGRLLARRGAAWLRRLPPMTPAP